MQLKKIGILLAVLLLTCLSVAGAEEALPTRVVSLSPAVTEVILDLGAAELLVGVDTFSAAVEGLPEGIPSTGGMTDPDVEFLVALAPEIIFISNMSALDNFEPLIALGIEVLEIPSSESVEAIYEDNLTIGRALGLEAETLALNEAMRARIEAISAIGAAVEAPKRVYFEISAAPYLYSFGQGVFLDELISLAGAVNIFQEQEGWLSISEEAVLAANPDVILTNVHYIDNAVEEILARPGWGGITAIAEQAVCQVDENTTARANHRIALALEEMARQIYPELYE